MKMGSAWQRCVDRLDALQDGGKCIDFWLRDDDAVEPSPALDRLLDLTGRFSVPVTLAVIPASTDERLSRSLSSRMHVDVAVHGWSHRNHAPAIEKRQELGAHRPRETVAADLRAGWARLSALYPAALAPLLVPPWNRIDPGLVSELQEIGFEALSVFGPEDGEKCAAFRDTGLQLINTHVDVMDWHGTRGCRPHGDILRDIDRRLDEVENSGGSVGILTHHLVHDESVWEFLSKLFEITTSHPACRWRRITELIDR
ncbi:polysaccharide deacetylase family protein (plasmid) [Sinorhizobium medicae]|uniref:polysaccharide deacetylase family protein n=1 Tax=Sinorhizobium medicae TaxID=110321 RepID=UPI00299E9220|nr:polysaccharide deacetylase family protein [Sinorhizobium medicae]MDX0693150.1 polysaccharide deacetylase [Sinorhizobium medicae]MDX0742558.1 polysaccharide deacetylase [Sinorhizobium medicae]WQO55663.1 polysaccharide deacetylase family protein [Sinorhizobium medicae]